MADIASRPAYAPHVPWRTVTVAFLIGALILAATVAYLGSREARVAPPFGTAGNGPIAYARDGDIFTVDPTSGATLPLITGATTDVEPVFSPDGTRLAFRRTNMSLGSPAEDLVVANPDGSNPIVITETPIQDGPFGMAWAPDSRSLLAVVPAAGEVRLYDAVHPSPPRVIARGADVSPSPFRPPDGASILIARATDDSAARHWSVVDLATLKETPLFVAADPSFARWSPDGSRVVFVDAVPDAPDSHLLYAVNADGTDQQRVTDEAVTWAEFDPIWSPDGTRIAFSRAEKVGNKPYAVRPIGIVDVATREVTGVGPLARDVRSANPSPGDIYASEEEAFNLDWSPDGQYLLATGLDAAGHPILIDATSGQYRVLDVIATPPTDRPTSTSQAWQRTAP